MNTLSSVCRKQILVKRFVGNALSPFKCILLTQEPQKRGLAESALNAVQVA